MRRRAPLEEHEPDDCKELELIIDGELREEHVGEALGEEEEHHDHPKGEPLAIVVAAGRLDGAYGAGGAAEKGEGEGAPLGEETKTLGLADAVRSGILFGASLAMAEGIVEGSNVRAHEMRDLFPLLHARSELAFWELVLARMERLAPHALVRPLA